MAGDLVMTYGMGLRSAPGAGSAGAATADAARPGGGRYVLCEAGGCVAALPIANVLETMRPRPLRPLPGAPAFISGASIIRGGPVPVVRLGELIGGEPHPASRLVTVCADGQARLAREEVTAQRMVGLAVESVLGVRWLPGDRLVRPGGILDDPTLDPVRAVGIIGSRVLYMLTSVRLVPEDVWQVLTSDAQPAAGGAELIGGCSPTPQTGSGCAPAPEP
jgi:purine-binding chemotaxis protein CheW